MQLLAIFEGVSLAPSPCIRFRSEEPVRPQRTYIFEEYFDSDSLTFPLAHKLAVQD